MVDEETMSEISVQDLLVRGEKHWSSSPLEGTVKGLVAQIPGYIYSTNVYLAILC